MERLVQGFPVEGVGFSYPFREMLRTDHPPFGDQDGPFDDVSQLPDISGPIVFLQEAHGGRFQFRHGFAEFLGILFQKLPGQDQDVLFPVPAKAAAGR